MATKVTLHTRTRTRLEVTVKATGIKLYWLCCCDGLTLGCQYRSWCFLFEYCTIVSLVIFFHHIFEYQRLKWWLFSIKNTQKWNFMAEMGQKLDRLVNRNLSLASEKRRDGCQTCSSERYWQWAQLNVLLAQMNRSIRYNAGCCFCCWEENWWSHPKHSQTVSLPSGHELDFFHSLLKQIQPIWCFWKPEIVSCCHSDVEKSLWLMRNCLLLFTLRASCSYFDWNWNSTCCRW